MLRVAVQIAAVAAAVAVVWVLVSNVQRNSDRLNIPTSFDYLDNPSQFTIPDTDFRQTQPVRDAIIVGLWNTVRISVAGIVLATLLGTLIGVARLSGNWLVRSAARVYVELVRNIPLYIIIVFSYGSLALVTFPRIEEAWRPLGLAVLSNRGLLVPRLEGTVWVLGLAAVAAAVAAVAIVRRRYDLADRTGAAPRWGWYAAPASLGLLAAGWLAGGVTVELPAPLERGGFTGGLRLGPELFAILFALVLYTSSHIAEIVRGSIQAVQRGQGEAASALALSSIQRLWYVVLPQAFRIAVPPLGNQYLNLLKNSTLGLTVSYFELARVTSISVGNGAPAVPSYLLTLAIFLVLSLVVSALVNVANRRLALEGR